MVYMVTFTINIPMLAYIPYMDPMGIINLGLIIPLQQSSSHRAPHRTAPPASPRWASVGDGPGSAAASGRPPSPKRPPTVAFTSFGEAADETSGNQKNIVIPK